MSRIQNAAAASADKLPNGSPTFFCSATVTSFEAGVARKRRMCAGNTSRPEFDTYFVPHVGGNVERRAWDRTACALGSTQEKAIKSIVANLNQVVETEEKLSVLPGLDPQQV